MPLSYADNFEKLYSEVSEKGVVDILVSGRWNPVTGDIDPRDMHRAITGNIDLEKLQSDFAQKVSADGARAEQLYSFKYLPFAVMRVDLKGLNNVRNYSADIKIWENLEVKSQLFKSTQMVGAPKQWDMGGTGKGQTIAIIDSGVDASHPMLDGRVVFEACIILFGCKGGKSIDIGPGASITKTKHGTHVAGIAAGNGNGARGVAPEAHIASFKVLSENGGGRTIDILVAMDIIFQMKVEGRHNVNVVNMSLGGGYFNQPCFDHPFSEASLMLALSGVNVVAASGNEGFSGALSAPACAFAVTSVGAVDKDWKIADFSNASEHLTILAPGVDILSATLTSEGGHGMEAFDGTSMAAPHVAGALAVMRQLYPNMSSFDLVGLMKGGMVKDVRNGFSYPVLTMPGTAGENNTSTIPSSPNSEPAPVPVPEENGGTIAITG
ncbi:S8 family peptidase [Curvivirga aplysinae]|uniref:S8 family peptidase n=1 Tax=Curvivirga aplysinae TaxID=2529852 RepID=UPI001C3F6E30|nr:S8 family serine peptidase [Curvivirga aplysinae]